VEEEVAGRRVEPAVAPGHRDHGFALVTVILSLGCTTCPALRPRDDTACTLMRVYSRSDTVEAIADLR